MREGDRAIAGDRRCSAQGGRTAAQDGRTSAQGQRSVAQGQGTVAQGQRFSAQGGRNPAQGQRFSAPHGRNAALGQRFSAQDGRSSAQGQTFSAPDGRPCAHGRTRPRHHPPLRAVARRGVLSDGGLMRREHFRPSRRNLKRSSDHETPRGVWHAPLSRRWVVGSPPATPRGVRTGSRDPSNTPTPPHPHRPRADRVCLIAQHVRVGGSRCPSVTRRASAAFVR
jgi:hypothetical protein